MKAWVLVAGFLQDQGSWLQIAVRLSWSEHLQNARTLELSADADRGSSLALMGISLLILSQDLLQQELSLASGLPAPRVPVDEPMD